MAALSIPAISIEYVKVPVQAERNGDPHNPTASVVVMALVTKGVEPETGDWKVADWEDTDPAADGYFRARVLIGPGTATVLTKGDIYDCWVKITDMPEVPARLAGQVKAV